MTVITELRESPAPSWWQAGQALRVSGPSPGTTRVPSPLSQGPNEEDHAHPGPGQFRSHMFATVSSCLANKGVRCHCQGHRMAIVFFAAHRCLPLRCRMAIGRWPFPSTNRLPRSPPPPSSLSTKSGLQPRCHGGKTPPWAHPHPQPLFTHRTWCHLG